MLGFRQVR